MKTWLKWLLGIFIVVLVVGGIAAGAYWMHTNAVAGNAQFFGRGMMQGRGFDRDFGPGGMMGGRDFGRGFGGGMTPFGGMMGGRGGFGLGLFMLPLMLLRWLFPLAIFGLAIYGLVAWFNRRKVAPAAPMAASVASAPVEATVAAPGKTCPNCGQPVQADWKHCPNCATAL